MFRESRHIVPCHHFSKDLIKLSIVSFWFQAHSGITLKQYRCNQIQFICQRIAVMVITENNPVTIIRTDKLSRPTVTETN
ncbi:hypothetical protein EC178850_5472, partial [Escherichia coli 178850]